MALAIQSGLNTSYSSPALVADGWYNGGLATEAYPGELQELRQQRQQLNHIIEVMPAGVIILDGNGIVIQVNQLASQFLEEPILGQAWFNVIQQSFKPREDDWHEVSLNDGRRVKLDIMPLKDKPGQLILITDLTETRLLQDKLAQMKRLSSLGHMVSTLAHQIRTPLSAAMLYGANLSSEQLSIQSRGNFQTKLMARLHDLEQQVNDMLLFAKSGNKQVVQALSVNELVKDTLTSMDAQISASKTDVTLTLCASDCVLLGNKSALTGALQNLIHNSIDIIKTNIKIKIATYCQHDQVYISVSDNGPGIAHQVADKLFEPFVTAREKGTGLGLAVVKSVAKAHQGDVTLLKNKDVGAHFVINIPQYIDDKKSNTQQVEVNHEHK